MSTSPLDFVTICFEKEAGLLRLQARSFAQFVDPKCVNLIYLILDDFISPEFHDHVHEKVLPEYRHFIPKVRILRHLEIIPTITSHEVGWRRQQAWKLMAASQCNSNFCVILDGKNHFIRHVNTDDFVVDGRPVVMWEEQPGSLACFHADSLSYFGLNPAAYVGAPQPTTPYAVNTTAVRAMIREIEKREHLPFHEWFLYSRALTTTEFYLVHAWNLHSQNHGYEIVQPMVWGILPPEHQEKTVYQIVGWIQDHPRYKTMFVHHRALPGLISGERYRLWAFWSDMGLSVFEDELDEILCDDFQRQTKIE